MKQWMRFADLGKQFGVSRATLNRWIKNGLPHHKVGRVVLFDPVEVEGWIRGLAPRKKGAKRTRRVEQ